MLQCKENKQQKKDKEVRSDTERKQGRRGHRNIKDPQCTTEREMKGIQDRKQETKVHNMKEKKNKATKINRE